MSWLTVSNALEKSKKSPKTQLPLLSKETKESIRYVIARFVEYPSLNPNWYSKSILCDETKSSKRLYINFSRIFEKSVNTETGL